MPQLESSLGGKKKEQEDKSPRIKSGSSLQLEWSPMLQLESSLLHVATKQGQPEDHHYRGSAPLRLKWRLHNNSKETLSHLWQL